MKELKKIPVIFFLICASGWNVVAQYYGVRKQIIQTKSYTEYIATMYQSRKALIDSLKNDNKQFVAVQKEIRIEDSIYTHGPERIITTRESILLDFYLNNFESLLPGISVLNYFAKSYWQDRTALGFEAGNISLDILDFWKQKSNVIIEEINSSSLAPDKIEFLIDYWKCILLFIESDNELNPEIKNISRNFISKYPDSYLAQFVKENMLNMRKVYRMNNFSIDINVGKPYFLGNLHSYLEGGFAGSIDMAIEINSWSYIFNYSGFQFARKDSTSEIGNISITNSNRMSSGGVGLKLGPTVMNCKTFRIKILGGVDFYNLDNLIDKPEGGYSSEEVSKTRPGLYVGTECFWLFGRMFPYENINLYNQDEEKNKPFSPVYLKFRIGFSPQIFKPHVNITGSAFVWTIGIGIAEGKNKARYVKTHN